MHYGQLENSQYMVNYTVNVTMASTTMSPSMTSYSVPVSATRRYHHIATKFVDATVQSVSQLTRVLVPWVELWIN